MAEFDRLIGPHEAVDDGVAPALSDPGLDAVRCAECGSHTYCLLKGVDGRIHLVCSRCCGEKGASVDGVIPTSIGTPRPCADLSAPEAMGAAASHILHSWGGLPDPSGGPIGAHAPCPKEGDVVLLGIAELPFTVVGAAGGRVAVLSQYRDSIVDVPVAGLELVEVHGLVATWRSRQ